MIYLDYNATTPIRPEVIEAMASAMQFPANPSSIHAMGRAARKQLEEARAVIASSVSAWPNEVIFCGSGTEANNMAIRGFMDRPVLVAASEHVSVLKAADRMGGDRICIDSNGVIDLAALESKLRALGRPALVSVMLANNETGVISPIADVSKIVHRYQSLLHVDASQALSKMPVDMGMLGADMLTLCAHKSGGPVGVGALIIRNDLPIKTFMVGGGQELRRRSGTENLAAIMGWVVAIERGQSLEWCKPVESWLRTMEQVLIASAPDLIVAGADAPRLPNTSCLVMSGVSSDVQLMNFDMEGFCVSAGSACSSGRIDASHVLKAMGYDEKMASCAIRVSAGWNTKESDIVAFKDCWLATYQRLSKKAA